MIQKMVFAVFGKKLTISHKKNGVGKYLAGMYLTVAKMFKKHVEVSRKSFSEYGSKVKLYEGVATWFDRVRKYGESRKVRVEHYIISAGFKEMLQGVKVGKRTLDKVVDRIYASSFFFGEDGKEVWPATVIDYTGKTQMLYRIKKNKMDENDDNVNNLVLKDRVPFKNMIYIGDSETDVPCMKIVKEHGGVSIGVYSPNTANKDRIIEMMRDGRISFYTPACYTKDSNIEKLVKLVIDKTEKTAKYEFEQGKMVKEFEKELSKIDESTKPKHTVSTGDEKKSPTQNIIGLANERNGGTKDDRNQYRDFLDKRMTFASPSLSKDFNLEIPLHIYGLKDLDPAFANYNLYCRSCASKHGFFGLPQNDQTSFDFIDE